jgi:serine protease Do/serine protease DegQ
VKRGSPAWNAGLKTNDIITSVNKTKVNSLEDFKKQVRNNGTLLFNLTRDRRAMFLILR